MALYSTTGIEIHFYFTWHNILILNKALELLNFIFPKLDLVEL